MDNWTGAWALPSTMSPGYPWSPPALPELLEPSTELPELSDLEQQLQLQGIGDLPFGHQISLDCAITEGTQMDYYPEHNDATVLPQFGDADLTEMFNELQQKNDGKATEPSISNNEIKGCAKGSKLIGFFAHPLGAWGRWHQRKHRTRRTFWRAYLLGFLKHFKCEKAGKNNPHWTEHEICMLLNGLSEYGVGRWTDIKNAYFGTSIRTATHLKDKWRNLTEACGHEVRSKKKVKAQKNTQEMLRKYGDEIKRIAQEHAAQGPQRASRPKQLSLMDTQT